MFSPLYGGAGEAVDRLGAAIDKSLKNQRLDLRSVEFGPEAIPYLKEILTLNENDVKKWLNREYTHKQFNKLKRAATILSIISGDESISILQKLYDSGLTEFENELCLAIALRGSDGDIATLIRSLRSKRTNRDYPIITSLTLGALHVKEAIHALEDLANDSILENSTNARAALAWIKSASTPTIKCNDDYPYRELVSAILKNGIPGIDQFHYIHDKRNHGVWIRNKDGWIFQKRYRIKEKDKLFMDFHSHIRPDGTKAIVEINIKKELNGSEIIIEESSTYYYIFKNNGTFLSICGIYEIF
jgi:hypothetical protein